MQLGTEYDAYLKFLSVKLVTVSAVKASCIHHPPVREPVGLDRYRTAELAVPDDKRNDTGEAVIAGPFSDPISQCPKRAGRARGVLPAIGNVNRPPDGSARGPVP